MKREIIAFVGRQGSGKSFQSQKLVHERGFKKISFADPLRDIAFSVIGMDYEKGMRKYDELKRTNLINGLNFRNILENLGASVRKYDTDFWAQALITKIEQCTENVVIDDMRYPNEYELVRLHCLSKGYEYKAYYCNYQSSIYVEDNPHESARMSNYLAQKGYQDLQMINKNDIYNFSLISNNSIVHDKNSGVPGNFDIKQKGEEVLALLKGMAK
jgi:hypothetical protein